MSEIDFENFKPKGLEKIPSKKNNQKIDMEIIQMEQPDIHGVEATVKVLKFFATIYDGTAEALKDDARVSLFEALGIAGKLVPQALSLPEALPLVSAEIVFDKISENDAAQLVSAFDEAKNLKGDTRDAVKELLPILAALKNWGFKWFGNDGN